MKKSPQNSEIFVQEKVPAPQLPELISVNTVARSNLFDVEAVNLRFSNGVECVYERMRPSHPEAVMIVPVLGNHLLLIQEYAVGIETYQLGFPKGTIDPGEPVLEAANRELKEEAGFGANHLEPLTKLTTAPSWFSGTMNIVLADNLYADKLEGDEPEPLNVVAWPFEDLMALLNRKDFQEARNFSAFFLAREWLIREGRISC